MCNFKPNEKVVCVLPVKLALKGEIYTINHITNCLKCNELLFTIKELLTDAVGTTCNCGHTTFEGSLYKAIRFRKLDHQFAEDVIAYITELETVNI